MTRWGARHRTSHLPECSAAGASGGTSDAGVASVAGLLLAFVVTVAAGGSVLGASLSQKSNGGSAPSVESALVSVGTAGPLSVESDAAGALFEMSLMRPGDSAARCVVVSHAADSGLVSLALYASVSGTGLGRFLDLTIDQGSGGGYQTCAGFVAEDRLYAGTLSGFASQHHDFTTGLGMSFHRRSPGAVTYRFELVLRDDDAAQGMTSSALFTWEAQDASY